MTANTIKTDFTLNKITFNFKLIIQHERLSLIDEVVTSNAKFITVSNKKLY